MKRLYILYDANCGFCSLCRAWLQNQPAFIELVFIPKNWTELKRYFQGMQVEGDNELVVVADNGAVYRHDAAYLMCLYALERYRELSFRLAQPPWQPLARRIFDWLPRNRWRLSRWIGSMQGNACSL